MIKVFLTGGTGFIGRPLTKSLLLRGWSVTALARRPKSPHALGLSKMGAQLAAGDVTDRESMRATMSGVDIVLHNAGHYEFGVNRAGKEHMQAINGNGTDNVLGLAHELGVPRAVYVSTVQALGETGSQIRDETFKRRAPCRTSYEHSKTAAHEIACQHQQRGLPLIIVCPNAAIGANDHSPWGYLARLYVNRMMPPIGWAPNTMLCCVDVNDLAEGIALAAEKGRIGETYLLNGEPYSVRENLAFWGGRPGSFRPVIWLPAGLAAAFFAPLEPLQRILGLPAFISRETVRAASTNLHYSSEKAKRELGWTHRAAEEMWLTTIDRELQLLAKRTGQSWVQRLKPLETDD